MPAVVTKKPSRPLLADTLFIPLALMVPSAALPSRNMPSWLLFTSLMRVSARVRRS
jgi:hypothetical protein